MNSKIDLKSIFKNKFPKNPQWLIVLLVGILLVVIALPVNDDKKTETTTVAESEEIESNAENYEAKMEKKLAKILQDIEGVGNVKVMITLKESTEKVVEKDVEKSSRSEADQTVDTSSSESTVYSDNSSSGQEPYVSKEISPAVEGVLVIADGGDNSVVVQNITEAIQALFNVEMHKIKVMKSK